MVTSEGEGEPKRKEVAARSYPVQITARGRGGFQKLNFNGRPKDSP